MNKLLIITTYIVLTSCGTSIKYDDSNRTDLDTIKSLEVEELSNEKSIEAKFNESFCPKFSFKSVKEHDDSLFAYMQRALDSSSADTKNWEKLFFCAFPNSFDEMNKLFGYNEEIVYDSIYEARQAESKYLNKEIYSDLIGFFSELKSIPDTIYYEKYIRININGYWDADYIREAFGFHYLLISDTEEVCKTLSKFTDEEIESVFRFIFDGPHPKNKSNEKVYNELYQKIGNVDQRLRNLLKNSYAKLIAEDDGHDH